MSSYWILEYIKFNMLLWLCQISRLETNCKLTHFATGRLTIDSQFITHRLIKLQLTTCKLLDLQIKNDTLFDCYSQTRSSQTWLVKSHYFRIGFISASSHCKFKWNKGKQMFGNNVFYDKRALIHAIFLVNLFPTAFFHFDCLACITFWHILLICKVYVSRSFVLTPRIHMAFWGFFVTCDTKNW